MAWIKSKNTTVSRTGQSSTDRLNSDEVDLTEKFASAEREYSDLLRGVMKPVLEGMGRDFLGGGAYLTCDVATLIGLLAFRTVLEDAAGIAACKETQLFEGICRKLNVNMDRPTQFILDCCFDVNDRIYVPSTLLALQEYDCLNQTNKAAELAQLFRMLILKLAEMHPENSPLTREYLDAISTFLPDTTQDREQANTETNSAPLN